MALISHEDGSNSFSVPMAEWAEVSETLFNFYRAASNFIENPNEKFKNQLLEE